MSSQTQKRKHEAREKLIATLNDEQRMLYYEAEIARHDDQIAELYEITRGIVSWPRLMKLAMGLATLIGVMLTLAKGADILANLAISRSDRRYYTSELEKKQVNV